MTPDPTSNDLQPQQAPADASCQSCETCLAKGNIVGLKPGQMATFLVHGVAISLAQTGHDQPPTELCVKFQKIPVVHIGPRKVLVDPYARSVN